MVDLDTLAALDALQWLRTGEEVAKRFPWSEASVSRYGKQCLDLYGLTMERVAGEWTLQGDASLLQLQRQGHQWARWMGRRPLRLEATYWSGPLLCTPTPKPWLLGLGSIVGVARNLQLVRDRVVDVWLGALPDLPAADDPELVAIQLCTMPVHYLAAPDHPLLRMPRITVEQVAQYPTLALPDGAYPIVERSLKGLGLWSDAVRMQRYDRGAWEGKTETELTIGYGTVLSHAVSGGQLRFLPLQLPFVSGEALVLRREFLGQPALRALAHHVLDKLTIWAQTFPEINLVFRPESLDGPA